LRGSKKERRGKIGSGWGKEKRCLLNFIPWPGSHLHAARADGPRHPRGQSARRADGPDPRRGWSVITSRTSSDAPSPHEPRGRSALLLAEIPPGAAGWSALLPRTVRPPLLILA
jgi:hypothetical protein